MKVWYKPRRLLTGSGLLLVLAMLALELLPNTSPGFGPLQLSGLAFGILLLFLAQVRTSTLGIIATVVISILGTIVFLEFGIGFLGYEADYTSALIAEARQPLEFAPYWICDATLGCRFIADGMTNEGCPDPDSEKMSRFCIINSQGYHDTDEFISSPALQQADYRIMLLGDSFTFGATADYPLSFADLLNEHMQTEHNDIVWNLGIPGTATRQALTLAQEYVPIMQPDLVILGFFGNDFDGNLYPIDLFVSPFIENKYHLVNAYQLDNNFVPIRLDDSNVYFRAVGQPASNNLVEVLLRRTRLGSLGLNAIPSLSNMVHPDRRWNEAVRQTRDLLRGLQVYLESEDIPLIVLHIPSIEDIQAPTRTYTTFQAVRADLDLPTLNVLEHLNMNDYLPQPDGHWTNDGHAKVSEIIVACVEFMLANPNTICPEAVD